MFPVPDYVLIGHLTADLTPTGRALGGTVSYAARVIHSFGLKVGMLTSAVQDEPLLAQLTPYVSEMVVLPASATSTFENIYNPTGRIQYIRGVASKIIPSDIPAHWLSAPLVHLAPLTDEVDPQIAHQFKNSTTLLTLQGWLRRWDADGRVRFKPWFDPDVLKDIDIVVFSEEDIAEAPELEAQFAGVVKHLFVTRAEHGGTYYYEGKPISYSTPQVELIHPTGAGDVFAASLLCGLHVTNGDMSAAIRVAAQLAAISVTRVGLDSAPTPDEVQQTLTATQ
ncbi:MAG: PfkB family carbohydrate kinase [Chloroflexota bacterium]